MHNINVLEISYYYHDHLFSKRFILFSIAMDHTFTHTFTPRDNFETPVNLPACFRTQETKDHRNFLQFSMTNLMLKRLQRLLFLQLKLYLKPKGLFLGLTIRLDFRYRFIVMSQFIYRNKNEWSRKTPMTCQAVKDEQSRWKGKNKIQKDIRCLHRNKNFRIEQGNE